MIRADFSSAAPVPALSLLVVQVRGKSTARAEAGRCDSGFWCTETR
jgi:hypothetical protein